MYYDTAAHVALELVKRLARSPLPSGLIINVNVPAIPLSELKGIQVTRQGERHFSEPLMPTLDGRNKRIYWLGEPGRIKDDSDGTDFHAIKNGYAAVTPMQIDMTAHHRIPEIHSWLNKTGKQ
jgi:5'-nucleotidase